MCYYDPVNPEFRLIKFFELAVLLLFAREENQPSFACGVFTRCQSNVNIILSGTISFYLVSLAKTICPLFLLFLTVSGWPD